MNDELAPQKVVTVNIDGDAIEMQVYLDLDFEGTEYGLVFPVDLPVLVVTSIQDEDGEYLEPLDFPATKKLKAALYEATRPWGVSPDFRGDELYLVGDYPDDFLDDCDVIEVHVEDGVEEYAVLLNLEDGEQNFMVITPLVPEDDMYPVQFVDEKTARLLDDAELMKLEDLFRVALNDIEGEE
jgi:hypothetical protein